MSSKSFIASFGLLMICFHQFPGTANGIPLQLKPKNVFETDGELRTKKDTFTSFTPLDEDVIELEHLKTSQSDTISSINGKNSEDDNINGGGSGGGSINTGSDTIQSLSPSSSSTSSNDGGSMASGLALESAFNSPLEEQIQLENLPSLEKQLEAEAEKEKLQLVTGQPEKEEEMIIQHIQHRPPHIPYPITPPKINQQQQQTDEIAGPPPSSSKSYHGAARLAFGQHPEVLPTTTSKTTTTIQSTSSSASGTADIEQVTDNKNEQLSVSTATSESIVNSQVEIPSSSSTLSSHSHSSPTATNTTTKIPQTNEILKGNHPIHPGHAFTDARSTISYTPEIKDAETVTDVVSEESETNVLEALEEQLASELPETAVVGDKSVQDDEIVAELEATKTNVQRRSVNRISQKSAESLLRNSDSSFDMAQYVFWTGDEAGVARAVEEFIQQGLMTRENALKFLKEIRMGIEYLQKSYENRVLPEQKKRDAPLKFPINTSFEKDSSEPTFNFDVTPEPFKYIRNYPNRQALVQQYEGKFLMEPNLYPPTSLNLQRALDHLPSLMRLQEASTNSLRNSKEDPELNEGAGRAKLAEFLYAEYSLEEVIYQLSKVMFMQSLGHGSEQSQQALQRLINFLEREGAEGNITPLLQKKILDVLLAALSDTLSEHPELLATARAKLGRTIFPSESSLDPINH